MLCAVAFVAGCGAAEQAPVIAPVIEVGGDSGGQISASSEVAAPAPKPDHARCIADLVAATKTGASGPDAELFATALKARAAGDKSTARRRLLELTENHRGSPFVPRAYLVFGEMFAEEAVAEPSKWPVAANFYRETLKYPYPENDAFFYSSLRLGEAQSRQGDHAQALADFKRVLDGLAKHPDAPCMETIGDAAREALVTSYAAVGDARKALMFFRRVAADDLASHLMAVDLAAVYAKAGKTNEAQVVVEHVLSHRPAQATCVALTRVVAEHALSVAIVSACP